MCMPGFFNQAMFGLIFITDSSKPLHVDIEIPEESEMRVRLAEVRRQYKEKQKELAKLRRKKSE